MNVHRFMAGAAVLGLACLTYAHVWRVIGAGQTLLAFAFLIASGIDHFKKGRAE